MNQTESLIFGFFVRTFRKKNNWTLEALAHHTHYSYSMIRSIENGMSNLNEEGRNNIACLFGFQAFKSNLTEKSILISQLYEIDNDHAALKSTDRKELIRNILNDTSLIASFLYPQYLLIQLYGAVCDEDTNKEKVERICSLIESGLEFYTAKELSIYYNLLGMYVNDIQSETQYLCQAFLYDPDSFLINLHLTMNACFHQKLMEALQYLNRCKSLVFHFGSYYRFIQILILEAQIHIDLGNYEHSLMCLKNILTEKENLDPYLYQSCLSLLAFGFFRKKDMEAALYYAQKAMDKATKKPLLYIIALFSAFRLQDESLFIIFIHKAKDHIISTTKTSDNSFDRIMPWNALINGIIKWHDHNFSEAISEFENSIHAFEMDPLRPWILECLIELAQTNQNPELAFHYQKELTRLLQSQIK